MPLVQADASQLEWRTAVELSQDPIGIKEILEKQDIHSLNQKALQLPSRLIAKTFLFRTIFRGSGWAFANDPNFKHVSDDPDYWDSKNETFYQKYTGLDYKHKEWAQSVVTRTPLRSFTGTEWFVPMKVKEKINYKTGEVISKSFEIPWNDLANYPVQGTGADLMMIARISLSNRLDKYKMYKVLLFTTVHDSLICDCPKDQVQATANIMYDVFNDLPLNVKRLFNYELSIPFPCEVKVGQNLFDMAPLQRT